MAEVDQVFFGGVTLVFDQAAPLFCVIYAVVAAGIYLFLPAVIKKITNRQVKAKGLLLIAVVVFFGSLFLPSPLIHGQNTQFSTHFFGGGIFTGLVWLFLKKNLNWRLNPIFELLSLFLLVSGLGVANELFELFAYETGLSSIPLADTSWDLLANTLGALIFWCAYKLCQKLDFIQ